SPDSVHGGLDCPDLEQASARAAARPFGGVVAPRPRGWGLPCGAAGAGVYAPAAMVQRILVATDRSPSAGRAVGWAADRARRFGAELLVLQVMIPEHREATEAGAAEATRVTFAAQDLATYARSVAGDLGRAKVVVDTDPARAIVEAAHEEKV